MAMWRRLYLSRVALHPRSASDRLSPKVSSFIKSKAFQIGTTPDKAVSCSTRICALGSNLPALASKTSTWSGTVEITEVDAQDLHLVAVDQKDRRTAVSWNWIDIENEAIQCSAARMTEPSGRSVEREMSEPSDRRWVSFDVHVPEPAQHVRVVASTNASAGSEVRCHKRSWL